MDTGGLTKIVHFTPSVPYMYIPVSEFSTLSYYLTTLAEGDKPTADTATDTIFWEKTCSEVTNPPDLSFSLKVFDDDNNIYQITLKHERMMIEGTFFGQPNRCYVPIMRHFQDDPLASSNHYYLGSHSMYEEVVVYDHTPIDERNQNYS